MSSGRDEYMSNWTPEEEEYWKRLVTDPQRMNDLRVQQMKDHMQSMADIMANSARDKQVAGTHYKDMGVEPWDVVDTWPLEQRIGAYRHGALKYLMRMGSKDEQLQEIKKCGHYIEKLIEVLESVNGSDRTGL